MNTTPEPALPTAEQLTGFRLAWPSPLRNLRQDVSDELQATPEYAAFMKESERQYREAAVAAIRDHAELLAPLVLGHHVCKCGNGCCQVMNDQGEQALVGGRVVGVLDLVDGLEVEHFEGTVGGALGRVDLRGTSGHETSPSVDAACRFCGKAGCGCGDRHPTEENPGGRGEA